MLSESPGQLRVHGGLFCVRPGSEVLGRVGTKQAFHGFPCPLTPACPRGSPAVPGAASAPCGAVFPAQLLCKVRGCAAPFGACRATEQLQGQLRFMRGSRLGAGAVAPAASVPGVLCLHGPRSPRRENRLLQKKEEAIIPLCECAGQRSGLG